MHPLPRQHPGYVVSGSHSGASSAPQTQPQPVVPGFGPMQQGSVHLWVPISRVGMVIGSHGAVIRNLQERSNAIIRVHNEKIHENRKLFTIHGGAAECSAAKSLIMEIIERPRANALSRSHDSVLSAPSGSPSETPVGEVVETMLVPNTCVGLVIGKGGDTIRDLQIRSGALIKVTPDKDAQIGAETRPVQLSGSSHAVQTARNLISEVVQAAIVRKGSWTEPGSRAGPSSLHLGAYLNDSLIPTNAAASHSAHANSGAVVADRSLMDSSAVSVPTGISQSAPNEWSQAEVLTIPNDKVGLIIGRGGVTIRDLQVRSGARIQVAKENEQDPSLNGARPVTLTGMRHCIDLAKSLISRKLNMYGASSSRGPVSPQSSVRAPPSALNYSLNPAQYHRPSAQYMYPGFAADLGSYSDYSSTMGFDGNDAQGAAHRTQIPFYGQFYGYHAPYSAIGNSAAAVAAAQAQAAQFEMPSANFGQERDALSGTLSQAHASHEATETQHDLHHHFGAQEQISQISDSPFRTDDSQDIHHEANSVHEHRVHDAKSSHRTAQSGLPTDDINQTATCESEPDGVNHLNGYRADSASVNDQSTTRAAQEHAEDRHQIDCDVRLSPETAASQSGAAQLESNSTVYSESDVSHVHRARTLAPQSHQQTSAHALQLSENVPSVNFSERSHEGIKTSARNALAASP